MTLSAGLAGVDRLPARELAEERFAAVVLLAALLEEALGPLAARLAAGLDAGLGAGLGAGLLAALPERAGADERVGDALDMAPFYARPALAER